MKFTYLKDKLAARTNGQMRGDLLVIRATFTIKRSDFGINPKAPEDNVSDTIELALSLAGGSPPVNELDASAGSERTPPVNSGGVSAPRYGLGCGLGSSRREAMALARRSASASCSGVSLAFTLRSCT